LAASFYPRTTREPEAVHHDVLSAPPTIPNCHTLEVIGSPYLRIEIVDGLFPFIMFFRWALEMEDVTTFTINFHFRNSFQTRDIPNH
jgi:hypothetical protein